MIETGFELQQTAGYSLTLPEAVIMPMLLTADSVNQRFLSDPKVIETG